MLLDRVRYNADISGCTNMARRVHTYIYNSLYACCTLDTSWPRYHHRRWWIGVPCDPPIYKTVDANRTGLLIPTATVFVL